MPRTLDELQKGLSALILQKIQGTLEISGDEIEDATVLELEKRAKELMTRDHAIAFVQSDQKARNSIIGSTFGGIDETVYKYISNDPANRASKEVLQQIFDDRDLKTSQKFTKAWAAQNAAIEQEIAQLREKGGASKVLEEKLKQTASILEGKDKEIEAYQSKIAEIEALRIRDWVENKIDTHYSGKRWKYQDDEITRKLHIQEAKRRALAGARLLPNEDRSGVNVLELNADAPIYNAASKPFSFADYLDSVADPFIARSQATEIVGTSGSGSGKITGKMKNLPPEYQKAIQENLSQ